MEFGIRGMLKDFLVRDHQILKLFGEISSHQEQIFFFSKFFGGDVKTSRADNYSPPFVGELLRHQEPEIAGWWLVQRCVANAVYFGAVWGGWRIGRFGPVGKRF